MRVYRPLIAKSTLAWDVLSGEGGDLVPSFELPERIRGSLLGRSLAELPPARAAGILGYVLSVANAIAVADRLRLSDSNSIPQALDKAVRGIEGGLRELASVRDRAPHEVLDETLPLDLFRIGATLDRALRRR